LLIGTRIEPDGVSVEVRDSGPGFAPADLDRLFEVFYTTKLGGLGLGLSICRSIIEAHNGRSVGRAQRATWCYLSFHCAGSSGRRIVNRTASDRRHGRRRI
jgi:K+-sensing histidine kinase KdpD